MRVAPPKSHSLLVAHPTLRRRRAVLFAGIAAAFGLVVILIVTAAGNYGVFEVENGTVANGAKIVSVAGASGGRAVQFATNATATPAPTPAPTSAPNPPSAFPDATNTGYIHALDYPGKLTECSGTSIQSNHTYNFCDFSDGAVVGSQSAPVSNVTFHGCWFHSAGQTGALVILYGDNLTFDYSSFTPDVSAPPVAYSQSYEYGLEADGGYYSEVQQLTVTNSNFWGFQDAIDTNGSTKAKPQVFRNNYLHDTAADGGVAHVDGIGTLSGTGTSSYDVIDHNTIMSSANTNAIAFQGGTYSHIAITNNQLGGFGYTINISGTQSYITFTGNTFSTLVPMSFGPLYPSNFWNTTGSTWSGNKWLVPAGASWGNAAHNGWFWVPSDNGSGDSNDAPFVSQTDYTG